MLAISAFFTPGHQEITFETVQEVVESSGVDSIVMEAVFGGLKQLEEYNY